MFFILSSKIALFCTKQGSTMRLHRTLPQGSSLEFTAFFMNRSLASRMLMLGLPLLALVLLLWYGLHEKMSRRVFGGITGDLAGFYISLAELLALACAAFGGMVL